MNYIAHTKDGKNYIDEKHTQPLKVHLSNVSKYAGEYADSFDAGEVGAALGLIHDIGKYQKDFQDRIRGKRIKVDHATQAAKLLIEELGEMGRLYGMVVSGHHTGLKDSGSGINVGDNTYSSRLNNYIGQEICYKDEIYFSPNFKNKQLSTDKNTKSFSVATYLKMLFSALVDADWTDTEEYVTDIPRKGIKYEIEDINEKLKANMPVNDHTAINNIRAEILSQCNEAALDDQGLFTLTVPTGGGKTLSSLSFALEHALRHNLKRIIYVIPYTSIIEQNADVIGKCVGEKYVLQHHSNSSIALKSEDGNESIEKRIEDSVGILTEDQRLKWASENWDIPIILTTNVQFFESFFSNMPSKTRKLHNIAESVVIFDEAQMLPRELLSPSMYAISELIRNYKVTAVLCSATQPAIKKYKYEKTTIKEIIKNPEDLFNKLKRVNYELVGEKTDEEIVELLQGYGSALCVVNSRRHAHVLYELARSEIGGNVYHLSTLMTAMHRRETLATIKEKLENEEKILVISTSLIEAGVDIDFPVVMRSIAGVDSIIQAGGRANREGKLDTGKVVIFEPTSEEGKIPKSIQGFVSITKELIASLKEKAFELEGIKMYFEMLYKSSSSDELLDSKHILDEFNIQGDYFKLNFETVASKYKIIEDNTKSIVINNKDEIKQLVEEMRQGIFNQETVRKVQQYSVSIYENEYQKLLKENVLEVLRSGYVILNNKNYYNEDIGLDIYTKENKNAAAEFI